MLLGSTDYDAIMKAAFEGDECHIFVSPLIGDIISDGRVNSDEYVYCVFGNDGWDVISDYSISLEDLLEDALAISDQYSD
jgi:hypothetical protein